MNIFLYDHNKIFTEQRIIDPMAAIPKNSCFAEPPTMSNGQYARWGGTSWEVLNEYPPEVPRDPATIQQEIVDMTQSRLDRFAHTRNYDNIMSACTYAASTIPQFQTEGLRCVLLRDTTWAALYTILAEVQAATRPMPNSFSDIEGDLPILSWD